MSNHDASQPALDRVSAATTAQPLVPHSTEASPAGPGSLASLRRDLQAMLDGFRGVQQPTFTLRQPRRSDRLRAQQAPHTQTPQTPQTFSNPQTLGLLKPRPLVVRQIVRETDSAVTLVLADEHGEPLPFFAGQFFTLLVPCDPRGGAPLRRAYSACTSPLDADGQPARTVAITCKRVAGGIVSNYLNDRVAVGDVLQVLGPSGHFTPQPAADKRRHVVLIGGGSGITPLMSILRTLLACEPASRITLLYGNRQPSEILFRAALFDLAAQHPDRLRVRHVVDEAPADWTGGQGLLDEKNLQKELHALSLLPAHNDAAEALPLEFYLCGPAPMMAAARRVLSTAGVTEQQIWEERFASLHDPVTVGGAANTPVAMQLRVGKLNGAGKASATEISVVVKPGETLLEAGLAAGAKLPFSCAMGGCGACKGRLRTGDVVMSEPNCLTAGERAQGYILPCIAKPTGAVQVEVES